MLILQVRPFPKVVPGHSPADIRSRDVPVSIRSQPLLLVVVVGLCVTVLASAEDWPHWRGSQRNGLIKEVSGWNGSRWIDSKPTWTANVGEGASSPLRVTSRTGLRAAIFCDPYHTRMNAGGHGLVRRSVAD